MRTQLVCGKLHLTRIKFKIVLTALFVLALTVPLGLQAAEIYRVTCPECDYSISLRKGRTKQSDENYAIYHCSEPNSFISLHTGQIDLKSMTSNENCKTKLEPINVMKPQQICPICNKGKLIIELGARAC